MLPFAISESMILPCEARYHALPRGSLAIWFANSLQQPMPAYDA
jgi:hypothetical protein